MTPLLPLSPQYSVGLIPQDPPICFSPTLGKWIFYFFALFGLFSKQSKIKEIPFTLSEMVLVLLEKWTGIFVTKKAPKKISKRYIFLMKPLCWDSAWNRQPRPSYYIIWDYHNHQYILRVCRDRKREMPAATVCELVHDLSLHQVWK